MDFFIEKINLEDYENYKNHIKSNFTKEYYEDFLKNVLNNNHQIFVIKNLLKNNEIIASGTILIEKKLTYGGCKMGHIENILVEEIYRGNGYGKKIVQHLVDYARDKKCYRIDLSCEEKLIKFYKIIK